MTVVAGSRWLLGSLIRSMRSMGVGTVRSGWGEVLVCGAMRIVVGNGRLRFLVGSVRSMRVETVRSGWVEVLVCGAMRIVAGNGRLGSLVGSM